MSDDKTEEIEKENIKETETVDKEKILSPTKRYLPKACTRKIVIPFVMPWEASAAKQTQKGMGAFGASRNSVARVNHGEKALKQGAMKSECTLTRFVDTGKFANQTGMSGFGAARNQITTFTSSKMIDPARLLAGEGIIPKQSGTGVHDTATQSGETPMGSIRSQTTKIHYKDDMSNRMDPESETFVHRLITPNPNNHAGSGVMDTRRKHVLNIAHHDRFTENILPRLRDFSNIPDCKGTGAGIHGLGLFRPTITNVKDGYGMTYDEELASKLAQTWINSGIIQSSQEGSGGYGKHRDVVSKVSHAIQDQQVPRKRYFY